MDDFQTTARLNIQVVELDASPVVILAGEIDVNTVGTLRRSLELLHGRVLVDLYAVSFMDSSGVAALVAARKRLIAIGGSLQLRSPQHQAGAELEFIGLGDLMLEHQPGADRPAA
jgi:anti-anti-sigma factor